MADITHPELVRALVKPPENIISSLSIYTADLWHGATGVAGEAGELLEGLMITQDFESSEQLEAGKLNLMEESGDLYFYIEQLVQRAELTIDWYSVEDFARNAIISPDQMIPYAIRVAIAGSQVLDTVKKAAVYNKELDKKLVTVQLTELAKNIMALGYMFGFSRDEALEANIAKLKKRYEGLQYTDRAAQLRMDKPPERKFIRGDADNGVVTDHK